MGHFPFLSVPKFGVHPASSLLNTLSAHPGLKALGSKAEKKAHGQLSSLSGLTSVCPPRLVGPRIPQAIYRVTLLETLYNVQTNRIQENTVSIKISEHKLIRLYKPPNTSGWRIQLLKFTLQGK